MPAVTDIPIRSSVDDIIRYWDEGRRRRLAPAIRDNLHELLVKMETERWLLPAAHYEVREVTQRGPDWLNAGAIRLASASLSRHLRQATHLVFGVCTLGHRMTRQIRGRFAERQRLQAVLLDEIGTVLLYQLSDYLDRCVCELAKSMSLQASGPLNPGDDGFDIHWQETVLEQAGGGAVGVSMTGSGTLAPHKSLTMVIGLGQHMPAWDSVARCNRCRSRSRCPYRQELPAGVVA
jgi:hypothetical protein